MSYSAIDDPTARVMIISSDGHAMARMPEYKQYLPSKFHADFTEFCALYERYGFRSFDTQALSLRLDKAVVDQWVHDMHESGKVDGNSDPHRRLEILEAEGIVAEVLFPDFGLPFELFPPTKRLSTDQLPPGAEKFS